MVGHLFYVLANGKQDLSRWLRIAAQGDEIVLYLTDLCHPGLLSGLARVTCPRVHFDSVLSGGVVQIVSEDGYLVARRDGSLLSLEFRGETDRAATKVSLFALELQTGIGNVQGSPPSARNTGV